MQVSFSAWDDVDLPRKSPSRLFPKAAAGHGCAENAACLIMADWKPKRGVLFLLLPFLTQVEATSRTLGRKHEEHMRMNELPPVSSQCYRIIFNSP